MPFEFVLFLVILLALLPIGLLLFGRTRRAGGDQPSAWAIIPAGIAGIVVSVGLSLLFDYQGVDRFIGDAVSQAVAFVAMWMVGWPAYFSKFPRWPIWQRLNDRQWMWTSFAFVTVLATIAATVRIALHTG